LRRFHGLLRRMYIMQKLDGILCTHQLGPFDLWCDLVLEFFFYYSYVHTMLGLFLPTAPTPSLTTHSAPSLSPPTPLIPGRNYFALTSNFVEDRV
jgi:hypothetical protein